MMISSRLQTKNGHRCYGRRRCHRLIFCFLVRDISESRFVTLVVARQNSTLNFIDIITKELMKGRIIGLLILHD